MEAAALISSIASTVLAVVAIWLSVTFYRLGNASSAEIQRATGQLQASTEQLEKAFGLIYRDMFTLVEKSVVGRGPAEALLGRDTATEDIVPDKPLRPALLEIVEEHGRPIAVAFLLESARQLGFEEDDAFIAILAMIKEGVLFKDEDTVGPTTLVQELPFDTA